jgi:hypothetical protein
MRFKKTLISISASLIIGLLFCGFVYARSEYFYLKSGCVSPTVNSWGICSETDIITPLIIGGTTTTSDLTLQTTTGVGTTGADMHFLVGNNGGTEAMTILNNGNVGIGTAAPSEKLDVVGNTEISGQLGIGGVVYGSAKIASRPASGQEGLIIKSTITPHDADYMKVFDSSENSIFVIDSSGNVGIGTATPGAILDVNGDGIANGVKTLLVSGEPTSAYLATFEAKFGDASTNALAIAIDKDATAGHAIRIRRTDDGTWNGANIAELFEVTEEGKVGIGTTAPAVELEIRGTAYPTILVASSDTEGGQLQLQDSTNTWAIYNEAGDLRFYEGADWVTMKQDTGNVGLRKKTKVINNGKSEDI